MSGVFTGDKKPRFNDVRKKVVTFNRGEAAEEAAILQSKGARNATCLEMKSGQKNHQQNGLV